MMDKHDHFFTPDEVDEQIEYYEREWPVTPESQLLTEMHKVAQQIRAEQNSSLQRIWLRLEQKSREYALPTHHRRENIMQSRQSISLPSDANNRLHKRPVRRVWRALSITGAAAVVALIILSWSLVTHTFWLSNWPSGPAAAPKAQNIYQACSTPDTVATLRFLDNHHLDWSSTGKIAFTYWDALAVNGDNCMRDNHYRNNLHGVATAVWSPDGKYLLVQTSDYSKTGETDALYILDDNGKVLTSTVINQITYKYAESRQATSISPFLSSLSGGSPPISSFVGPVWSSDGSKISEIYSNGTDPVTLKSWTWDTHRLALTLNQPYGAHTLINTSHIIDASWSPDGKYIVAETDNGKTLGAVLDARTGALVKNLNITGPSIAHIVWSPDGKELAAISGATAQIVQFSTGKVVRTLAVPGGEAGVIPGSISWSPDGKYLATGYHQKTTIWDARTGKQVAHIDLNSDAMIVTLTWSPDSRKLAIQIFTGPSPRGQAVMYIWGL